MEPRDVLRGADALLRSGDAVGAAHDYARVARWYGQEGFALKALAIWKQVRGITRAQAPDEAELDAEARRTMVSLYRGLGLESDARRVESE